jgi:hypothetical protein
MLTSVKIAVIQTGLAIIVLWCRTYGNCDGLVPALKYTVSNQTNG